MGLFDRMLLLFLCISIGFAFWQPTVVFGIASPILYFNMDYNETSQSLYFTNQSSVFSPTTADANERLQSEGRGDTKDVNIVQLFLLVIDPVLQIIKFLALVFSILIAPLSIMLSSGFVGLPWEIVVGFCLPIQLMGWVSIVQIIRGVN